MQVLIKKITRFLVLGLLFFLPKERKIRIERWLRGREEYRKLKLADVVIVSFGRAAAPGCGFCYRAFIRSNTGSPSAI
jgi:hypothetical protein